VPSAASHVCCGAGDVNDHENAIHQPEIGPQTHAYTLWHMVSALFSELQNTEFKMTAGTSVVGPIGLPAITGLLSVLIEATASTHKTRTKLKS
jgi:hypothetical protein